MRRSLAVLALATLAVAGCGGATTSVPTHSTLTAGLSGASATQDTPPAAVVERAQAADPRSSLTIYATAGGKILTRLKPTTPYGSRLTLMVDSATPLGSMWLHVYLPTRPNGSMGWVKAGDVTLNRVDDAILVNVEAKTVTVAVAGRLPVAGPAAVGTKTDPTPKGIGYVTDVLAPANAKGAYGAIALGLSFHSDVLKTFGGSDGQIGMHGTNEPASLGKEASHGCIRVSAAMDKLLAQIPLGTPITIS